MPHSNDESAMRPVWLRLSKLPSIQGGAVLIIGTESHVGRYSPALALPRRAKVFSSTAHSHHEEFSGSIRR